jgi:hypothetical protein
MLTGFRPSANVDALALSSQLNCPDVSSPRWRRLGHQFEPGCFPTICAAYPVSFRI